MLAVLGERLSFTSAYVPQVKEIASVVRLSSGDLSFV
jgi:hypothetical protein